MSPERIDNYLWLARLLLTVAGVVLTALVGEATPNIVMMWGCIALMWLMAS